MKVYLFIFMVLGAMGEDGQRPDCSRIAYLPFSIQHRVCGSDGNTYVSRQHLRYENCVNDRDVIVLKDGWCDEETELGEQVKDVILTFVSAFVSEFRNELLKEGVPEAVVEFLSQIDDDKSEEENSVENGIDNNEVSSFVNVLRKELDLLSEPGEKKK
ncbi:uncharacterized protein LOC110835919 isoform X2 [Zootermopsis nevadensis]|uniref:uncharacterized protein LOC110835919 isoform X2 n=1 Tax=Zootermopsis nevadensis TaxID=136037 RepID=UPI000B8E5FA7|nr:uncharacterized protein LOC110835919 isoform X2 [Zootermopsis nevadensis]